MVPALLCAGGGLRFSESGHSHGFWRKGRELDPIGSICRAVWGVVSVRQRGGAPIALPRGSATVLVVEDDTAVHEIAAQC